jgi:hypothetical protein
MEEGGAREKSLTLRFSKELSLNSKLLRDQDFRIDVGSAKGGKTFVRVIHLPTQVSAIVDGLTGRSTKEVGDELRQQVEDELVTQGWVKITS